MVPGIGRLQFPWPWSLIEAGPGLWRQWLARASGDGTVGGIAGALIGNGNSEYEAKRYEGRVKEGGFPLRLLRQLDWTQES